MKKLIFIICLLVFVASIFAIKPLIRYENKLIREADSLKWEQFLICSENEGDAGCDSCYFLIYGEHVDTYSLFTDSIQTY